MQETEQFDWPIGALHNGVVRIGRNTFLQSLIDSDGLPWVGDAELKQVAADLIAARKAGGKERQKRLTERRREA